MIEKFNIIYSSLKEPPSFIRGKNGQKLAILEIIVIVVAVLDLLAAVRGLAVILEETVVAISVVILYQ